jgi:1,4-dihydroxy-2-naphthoate octaprenyltransferase
MSRSRQLWLFLLLSRPHFLLGGLALFALGAVMARYLGHRVDAGLYVFGQALVTSGQLMTQYLNEYYDAPLDSQNQRRTWLSGGSGAIGPGLLSRRTALYAAIVCLAFMAILSSGWLIRGTVPLLAWLLFVLLLVGAYSYSAPPLRLQSTGYGELIASVIVGGIVPSFAFALQTGELHRILFMSTAPLVALCFAMIIVFELPDYPVDARYEKNNLLVRLGWQNAMRLHDLAIAFAFLSYLLAYLFGFPRRVSLGAVIVLPLALAQVWQMARLRSGFRPQWRTLTLVSLGVFALAIYMELVGFWLS